MKETTKELIEWIKESLPTGFPNYRQEAIYFLDSLPEIESHLCKGGYIQDRNGTPCCDGDKVTFRIYGGYIPTMTGILFWSYSDKRFFIETPNTDIFIMPRIEWFEKVE